MGLKVSLKVDLPVYVRQTGELTDDECSMIMYYAKELERELAPYCQNHRELTASK